MKKSQLLSSVLTLLFLGAFCINLGMEENPRPTKMRKTQESGKPSNTRHNRFSSMVYLPHNLSGVISDEQADKFGQKLNRDVFSNQLVLVKVPGGWKFAFIVNISGEGVFTFRTCGAQPYDVQYQFNQMRDGSLFKILKPYYQCMWQSGVATPWFMAAIDDLLRVMPQSKDPNFQGFIIPADSYIGVIGDLHGDVEALQHNMQELFNKNFFDENLRLRPKYYIVLTGDYADRGTCGAEIYYILSQFKVANPEQVFLLHGNHEFTGMAKDPEHGGLFEELGIKYGDISIQAIAALFDRLPYMLLIGLRTCNTNYYNFVQFCHGGIDPEFNIKNHMIHIIENPANINLFTLPEPSIQPICSYDFVGDTVTQSSDRKGPAAADKLKTPQKKGKVASRRQNGVAANTSMFRDYLTTKSTDLESEIKFELTCVIRGHEHDVPSGAARLLDTDLLSWKPLAPGVKYPLEKTVYTFISCPHAMPAYVHNYTHGILHATDYGRWYLTVHAYPVPMQLVASAAASSKSAFQPVIRGITGSPSPVKRQLRFDDKDKKDNMISFIS